LAYQDSSFWKRTPYKGGYIPPADISAGPVPRAGRQPCESDVNALVVFMQAFGIETFKFIFTLIMNICPIFSKNMVTLASQYLKESEYIYLK
jgi:hypothetical protein